MLILHKLLPSDCKWVDCYCFDAKHGVFLGSIHSYCKTFVMTTGTFTKHRKLHILNQIMSFAQRTSRKVKQKFDDN